MRESVKQFRRAYKLCRPPEIPFLCPIVRGKAIEPGPMGISEVQLEAQVIVALRHGDYKAAKKIADKITEHFGVISEQFS